MHWLVNKHVKDYKTCFLNCVTIYNYTMDKKQFQRLPRTVVPVNYDITLTPDFEGFTFSGNQNISVKINETVSEVTMNSVELVIMNVTWTGKSSGVIQAAVGLPVYDGDLETVTFTFEPPLKAGSIGSIAMEFEGTLKDDKRGFFRSKFTTENGKEKWIAVTQFEATHARRCFVCFDEPSFKATFDIGLIVEKGKVALSNMKVERCRPVFANEVIKHHIRFETTPIMSTYLLGLAVGDFDYIETTNDDVKYRVYTQFCKKKKGKFALEVASRAIPFFTNYFGLCCGLKKVDLVAIPEFCRDGIENWGLAIFNETKLLDDDKKSIALIVAHELCHFWFGNLVSMEWWSHLWLKEGFAVYFEYFCVDKLYPEFNIWSKFNERSFNKAMNMDSWNEGHPLEAAVGYPSEIEEIFDEITYEKGASIIRMLYQYVGGDECFRKGVNLFLKRHQYKTAVTKDLWMALEEASGKPIQSIMDSWIKEEGFPEVRITSTSQRGKHRVVNLTQQKYNQPSSRHKWQIPLTFSSSSNPDEIIYSDVMKNRSMEVVIPDVAQSEWIELNHKSVGFYMVHCPTSLIGIYNNDRPVITADVPSSSMDENEAGMEIGGDDDDDDVVLIETSTVNPQMQIDLENESLLVTVAGTISPPEIHDEKGHQRKRPREEESSSDDSTPQLAAEAESGCQAKKFCQLEVAVIRDAIRRGITFDVLPPVDNFTGRRKELEELHEMLLNNEADQIIWICGGEGIGKTELIRRYISANGKDFDSNFIWMNAETEDSLMKSFQRFKAAHLPLANAESESANRSWYRKGELIIKEVCTFFDKSKALFVFDNANLARKSSYRLYHDFLSCFNPDDKNPNFRFIVISREKGWGDVNETINLKPLPLNEILAFVIKGMQFDEVNESMEGNIHNFVGRQETQSLLNAVAAGAGAVVESSTSVEEPYQRSLSTTAELEKELEGDCWPSASNENGYLMDLADINEEFWKAENRASEVSLCLVLEHVSQQRCYFNPDRFCVKHFLQFWEEDRFQLRTQPFSSYNLESWRFDEKNVMRKLMPLWEQFAQSIRTLELSFCSTEEVISENFYKIVFNSTPNLRTLVMYGNEFKQPEEQHKPGNEKKEEGIEKYFQIQAIELAETLSPNFELVKIFMVDTKLPFSFDIFFAMLFPNIEDAFDRMGSCNNGFCLQKLLSRRDTAGICPVKHLQFNGSGSGENWRNLFLSLRQAGLPSLEKLDICMASYYEDVDGNGDDEWIDEFNECLKSFGTSSLKVLKLNVWGPTANKLLENNLFCIGENNKMTSLKELWMKVPSLENLNFIAGMPSLQFIRVESSSSWEWFSFKEVIKLDGIPNSRKLPHLKNIHVDYHFSVEDLNLFGKSAQNITYFGCKADNSTFRVICSLWKLKELELLRGSSVDDKGITGILNRKCVKPVEPNITALKSSLQILKISCCGRLLTDISVYRGFLLLEKLERLTIQVPFKNQISPVAKELLREKLSAVPHIIDSFCVRPFM